MNSDTATRVEIVIDVSTWTRGVGSPWALTRAAVTIPSPSTRQTRVSLMVIVTHTATLKLQKHLVICTRIFCDIATTSTCDMFFNLHMSTRSVSDPFLDGDFGHDDRHQDAPGRGWVTGMEVVSTRSDTSRHLQVGRSEKRVAGPLVTCIKLHSHFPGSTFVIVFISLCQKTLNFILPTLIHLNIEKSRSIV